MREAPQHWWLIAWAAFLGLFVLLAQLAPVVLFPIFYKFAPLENEELKARLVRLGERAGTRVRGVYQWKLSEKSKKANAALTGLGNTRRIILADTLLANYSTDEIEAVLAHELGHHVHRHIFKSILVQAGITFVGFWAANWVLHYAVDRQHMFETLSDFANLPLLMLVATTLSFLVLPLLNAYSRFNERQADRYAFRSIATVRLSFLPWTNWRSRIWRNVLLSQWVEWFFHSHPAISRRVAAAEAWARCPSVAGNVGASAPLVAGSCWRLQLLRWQRSTLIKSGLHQCPHEQDVRAYIELQDFFHASQIFFCVHADGVVWGLGHVNRDSVFQEAQLLQPLAALER